MSYSLQHENDRMKAQIRAMEERIAGLRAEQPAAERDAISAAKVRADSVAVMYGTTASNPVPGETSLQYRKRLLGSFQKFSDSFAHARLDSLDAATLAPIEAAIIAEATAKARDPASYQPGQLVPVTTFENGRNVTRYHGDISTWMAPYQGQAIQGRFNRSPPKEHRS